MDIKSEITQKEEYIKIKKKYMDECRLFALFGVFSSIGIAIAFLVDMIKNPPDIEISLLIFIYISLATMTIFILYITISPLFLTKEVLKKGVITDIYKKPIMKNGVVNETIIGEKYGYAVKVGDSSFLAYTINNKEQSLHIDDEVYLLGFNKGHLSCFK